MREHQLIADGSTVVVGFSGGPDSTFLLYLLAGWREQMGITIIAAHLDHGWRPESAQEVEWCRRVAQNLGVTFVAGRLADFASGLKETGSREDMGRRGRRLFLQKVAREHGAASIALAHHRDDQRETFFIRLLRGASLSGLACMKPRDGLYVRPLLDIGKDEILAYLHEHEITYLHDPSNESREFLRNRVRHGVIPVLRACDDRFDRNCDATLGRLQEAEELMEQLTRERYAAITHVNGDGVQVIDCKQLCAQSPAMQRRLMLHWLCGVGVPFDPSQALLDEILRFLSSPRGGTHQVHSDWTITKRAGRASICS